MQEEVTRKTVALCVETGKMTAQVLQKAMKKVLNDMAKAKNQPRLHHGKQTLRQLMKHNTGVSNIEITDQNIRAFSSTAKKYGLDFALKKDTSGEHTRYLVFFKGRDANDHEGSYSLEWSAISAASVPDALERSITYSMLLDGKEQAVYLDISDEEITLWDSASAGQIIAVAKYAQTLPGAAEALQDCDFTDLDEDGNSDLTANFSFMDGTTANLTWFYVDGGFVYNEEFSVLPGDAPTGNAE